MKVIGYTLNYGVKTNGGETKPSLNCHMDDGSMWACDLIGPTEVENWREVTPSKDFLTESFNFEMKKRGLPN